MKEHYNPHSSLSEVLSSVGGIAAIIYNLIIYSLSVTTAVRATSAGSYRNYRGGDSGEDINLYRGSIQSFGDPSVSNDRVCRNVVLTAVWIATVQALGSIVTHDRFFDEVRLRQMLRYLYSKDAEFTVSCIILLIVFFFILVIQVTSKVITKETAQAIKNIQGIIRRFPDYGIVDVFQLYPAKDVIMSTVALSRLQNIVINSEKWQTNAVGDQEICSLASNKDLIHDLAYYSVYANAAYGWKGGLALSGRLHFGDLKTLVARTGITEEQVIDANWHSKTHQPAYFLVRDDDQQSLVLCIRGTLSTRDVLTDLCCLAQSYDVANVSEDGVSSMKGRAHQGMLKAARGVSRQVEQKITSLLEQYTGYKIVLVGHSLGAGTAAVLGSIWQEKFKGKIKVFAYGSPCVGKRYFYCNFYIYWESQKG